MTALSQQERRVLELAAQGRVDKQIGQAMGISLGTVRVYWNRARTKTGGLTRSQILVMVGRGQVAGMESDDGLRLALQDEVRRALADLRAALPDEGQTHASLRFRRSVEALLAHSAPAQEGA